MQAKARRLCGFSRMRFGLLLVFLPMLAAFAPQPARAGLPEGLPGLPRVADGMLVSRTSGLAIGGYDVVTYHLGREPEPGLAAFETNWRGFVWRFASEANRQAFLADPESYIPLYEGLDPLGVAQERFVETDPYIFAIHRGRLALFRTEESRRRFLADGRLAREAAERWPELARQISR